MTQEQTNARLGDLPTGATFRAYRTAPSAWRVDGRRDGRIIVHNLYDVGRETDCSPAMSVWRIPEPTTLRIVVLTEGDNAPVLLGQLAPPREYDDGTVRYFYGPDEEEGTAPANTVTIVDIEV